VYDIISVAFIVGFFALCVAYAHACDLILGPDDQAVVAENPSEPPAPADDAVAA